MNVIVVDTSSWINYFQGKPADSIDLGLKEGRIHLSPVVAAELLSSDLSSSKRAALIDFLRELPLCDTGFDHWSRVGELRARLGRQGLNLSTPDTHVAQCALDLDGYLLSEDRIFSKVAANVPLRMA